MIHEQIELLKKAGLKPRSIESEMMALTRMLRHNEYLYPEQVSVVIDLGESAISSGLIIDHELVLTRSKNISFSNVNQAIREQMGCNYEEAQMMIKAFDFLDNNEPKMGVDQVLERSFALFFDAIKEQIEYYLECPESFGKIDQLLLVGGGTLLKNIESVHENYFKIPAKVVNPFRNIEVMNDRNPEWNEEMIRICPFMGVAVGLALSVAQEKQLSSKKEHANENQK